MTLRRRLMTLPSYWPRFALIGAQCVQRRRSDVEQPSLQLLALTCLRPMTLHLGLPSRSWNHLQVRPALAQTLGEVLLRCPPRHFVLHWLYRPPICQLATS